MEELKDEFGLDVAVRRGEANSELRELFESSPWVGSLASKQRGVVFLDPYGMTVGWDTLKLLADTRRVDVWYLFPRKAVVQQLAHDIRGIDDAKRKKLAEIFGGDDWEEAFYEAQPAQGALFECEPAQAKGRTATPAQIASFARRRLGKLFCYVSDPLPLVVNGSDFFELYCLSNNAPAIPLIRKGVEHVMHKYTPASHRMSGLLKGGR